MQNTLQKYKGFPLRISSVNVTKSAENCGFGHIPGDLVTFVKKKTLMENFTFCAVIFSFPKVDQLYIVGQ